MSHRTFLALLCLAALGAVLPAAGCARGPSSAAPLAAEDRARVEQEVRDAEKRFNESYQANDMETYWAFYADDLVQFFDTGRMSLEDYKTMWNGMLQAGGRVLEVRMEDVEVRVSPLGDAAGASYRLFVRLRDAQGKETSGWYLESDTWFRRDGRWQVVQLHYSEAHPPAAPGGGPATSRFEGSPAAHEPAPLHLAGLLLPLRPDTCARAGAAGRPAAHGAL